MNKIKFYPAVILLGLGVGIALAAALDNIAVGIGVVIGAGVVFSAEFKGRGIEEDTE